MEADDARAVRKAGLAALISDAVHSLDAVFQPHRLNRAMCAEMRGDAVNLIRRLEQYLEEFGRDE